MIQWVPAVALSLGVLSLAVALVALVECSRRVHLLKQQQQPALDDLRQKIDLLATSQAQASQELQRVSPPQLLRAFQGLQLEWSQALHSLNRLSGRLARERGFLLASGAVSGRSGEPPSRSESQPSPSSRSQVLVRARARSAGSLRVAAGSRGSPSLHAAQAPPDES